MYRIGSRAKQVINKAVSTPRVHSVFRNAANIEYEDDFLIAILPERYGCGPLAVTLKEEDYILLRQGMGCAGDSFDAKKLAHFGPEHIEEFAIPQSVDYGEADDIKQGVLSCRQLLTGLGKYEGAAGCLLGIDSVYGAKFEKAMEKLRGSIKEQEPYGFAAAAERIIGFGPGLTPSGDDFLYGLLAALYYGNSYKAYDSSWLDDAVIRLIPVCRQKTTIISFNMLRTCADREFNQHIINTLNSIFCGKQEQVEQAFCRLLDIGSSSGSDTAAGMIFGLETVLGI